MFTLSIYRTSRNLHIFEQRFAEAFIFCGNLSSTASLHHYTHAVGSCGQGPTSNHQRSTVSSPIPVSARPPSEERPNGFVPKQEETPAFHLDKAPTVYMSEHLAVSLVCTMRRIHRPHPPKNISPRLWSICDPYFFRFQSLLMI